MTPTPKFGKTPLELLEPNTDYDPTFFEAYGKWIVAPLFGVGMSMAANFGMKRPLTAGMSFPVTNQLQWIDVWVMNEHLNRSFKFLFA